MTRPDVIVIGAGVIGLSSALALQARGLSVTVLDREGPAAGASAGNASCFAFSEIAPLASPATLLKAPKWLLDPLGPLTIPPAYALKIAPWMARFAAASMPHRVRHSTDAQTALIDLARSELEPFLAANGHSHMLRKYGNLQPYESESEFRATLPVWQARERHGFEFRHLTRAEMDEIQPGLAPRFISGTFTPAYWSISDPKDYTLALAARFTERGGLIHQAEVTALRIDGDTVRIDDTYQAGQVVLAAGAFSHRIARSLGDRIPLETERGYNTTLPPGAVDLRIQITFGGHGFMVTKLDTGIRVGGAVELGGLDAPPNYKRAEAMLKKAKAFLPDLNTEGGRQWMGFRPSLPDTLPVIGPSGAGPRVTYAFGNGHLGLTQSAGTARLVADLVTGQPPAIDLAPFSPSRFQP
ncbi:NAD(P)/FAD-dependent oxidoreductase [Paracoccus aerodenitrificans]|uniref:NAD(P)/FAD-dependent oxidoreductase n=1 Tax=Paracoccus aerodenitrificans TaxID=3017781 RepID=UPI0022F02E58|nr:FAD-binding oxidoreductase [Paracoccus aerodenitrificans]WBU63734.1 FAD-binding oxidoreductase [Paracoccus aerodenitrificans]